MPIIPLGFPTGFIGFFEIFFEFINMPSTAFFHSLIRQSLFIWIFMDQMPVPHELHYGRNGLQEKSANNQIFFKLFGSRVQYVGI